MERDFGTLQATIVRVLPGLDVAAIRHYCEQRVPPHALDRYTARSGVWTLYCSDRNDRWQRYDPIGPTADIRVLLDEVDRDAACIFWA
jgi:hypothetical protein